jgi:hypothetical protein
VPSAGSKQGSLAEGRVEAADHHEAVTVAVKQHSNPFDDYYFFYFIVCSVRAPKKSLVSWGYKKFREVSRGVG